MNSPYLTSFLLVYDGIRKEGNETHQIYQVALYKNGLELACLIVEIIIDLDSSSEEDKGWQKIKKACQDGTF